MNAIVMHEYGGPDVLKYETYPDPVAGAGEVVVPGAVKAFFPLTFPVVIGWDIAGTVVRVGSGVTGVGVGDRVFTWAFHTYAELCAVKAELLAKVPDGLDLAKAGALPLVTVTGSQLALVAGGVQAGQTVLVSGALGAVGRSAVFAAKERGARVIAGVLKKQVDEAKVLGADQVVALDDESAFGALAPVDVVANTVRGKTAEQLLGKVKKGGVFASATGVPDNAEKNYPGIKTVGFHSKQDPKTLVALARAFQDGKLVIPIDRTMPLRDAAKAHAVVEKGVNGKVVLTV
jgi:NADPH:quinone reductase-like Zn-dependent oxidoreductase